MEPVRTAPEPLPAARRRARQIRIAAVIVLLLGIVSAAAVYWRGRNAVDLSNDLSMIGYDKSAARQMQMYYGQQGLVLQQLFDSIKNPGTQSLIIGLSAGLLAVACFYVARLVERDIPPED